MSKGDSIVKSENKSEGEKVRMRVDCESESDNQVTFPALEMKLKSGNLQNNNVVILKLIVRAEPEKLNWVHQTQDIQKESGVRRK
jgi:hypothetical protein